MRIKDIFIFFSSLLILFGLWQFVWLWIAIRGFKYLRENNETFFQFCCRNFDSAIWRIRKKFKMDMFYNSRVFKISVILKGLLLVLLGVVIIVVYFLIKSTEYGVWLGIKL